MTFYRTSSGNLILIGTLALVITPASLRAEVAVAVSPKTPSVQPGATQQFVATVSGTNIKAVTWSVNDVDGGNPTFGTIDSNGLYRAPTTAPNSAVTVKATSQADTTKSDTTSVTVATAPTQAAAAKVGSAAASASEASKIVSVAPKVELKPPKDKQGYERFAVGSTLVVTLDNDALQILKKGTEKNPLGLFFNKLFMDGIGAVPWPGNPNALQFQLEYTDANRDAWSQLFGRKMRSLGADDDVSITVGLKDGSWVAEDPKTLALKFLPDRYAEFLLGLSLVLAALTLRLGRTSSMLRDSGTPRTDKKLGTYSLGRSQMALWFVTIVFAFLFTYAVTGVVTPITSGALILMGIGAGTALGASAVDQNNQTASAASLVQLSAQQLQLQNQIQSLDQQIASTAPNGPAVAVLQTQKQTAEQQLQAVNDQLTQTAPPQVAASEGLMKDLLTDINGVSFHRLQIVAWTLVLWVLFMTSLFGKLTMMDFDATQLTLMGISGGTYLGFKLNEKQS